MLPFICVFQSHVDADHELGHLKEKAVKEVVPLSERTHTVTIGAVPGSDSSKKVGSS